MINRPLSSSPPLLWAVEDNPDMGKTLVDIFSRLGCAVRIFPSAEESLGRLRAGDRPDVLILDFRLPGMSGPQLFRTLCMEPRWRNVPVVPFTSYWHEEQESPVAAEWEGLASQVAPSRRLWDVPIVKKIAGDDFTVPERLLLSVSNVLKMSPHGLPKPFEDVLVDLVNNVMGGPPAVS